jgi:hypothetical protein
VPFSALSVCWLFGAWALYFSSAPAHNRIGDVNDTVAKEIPKILLVFFLGLAGSALSVSLLSWRDLALTGQSLSDCTRRIAAVEVLAAAIATENTINSLARTDHKAELGRIGNLLDRLREDVATLKQQPTARPDPFTGTQGRELEERIRQLERPR